MKLIKSNLSIRDWLIDIIVSRGNTANKYNRIDIGNRVIGQ